MRVGVRLGSSHLQVPPHLDYQEGNFRFTHRCQVHGGLLQTPLTFPGSGLLPAPNPHSAKNGWAPVSAIT